ncbi:hypothetical protein NX059_000306 [Plenodomus lindquistii]|nr:hypothetical protein NX059_000306 [Plenodomus lindquistii]
MGASQSTPPPLVYVPGGKVLVPSGSPLTIDPYANPHRAPYPSYPSIYQLPNRKAFRPSRATTSPHIPVFSPRSPPLNQHYRARRQPHPQPYPHLSPDFDIQEGSTETESTDADMLMGSGDPRMGMASGMRRRMAPGGMPGLRGGMGGRPSGYFDEERPRSAPEIGGGGRMGMHDPRLAGMGMQDPRMMGGAMRGTQPAMQQPPEYTSNPQLPQLGAATHPQTFPNRPSSTLSSNSSLKQTQPHRSSKHRSKDYTTAPMGLYTTPSSPAPRTRAHSPPPNFAAHMNRNSSRKVGASGKEWTDGNAFLDGCTCTTNCKCRKSHRVIYRRERRLQDGEESGEESDRQEVGEIRYIMRDDLGKDCGDHTECVKGGGGSGNDDGKMSKQERKKKKKEEKEKKKEEDRKERERRKEEERKDKEKARQSKERFDNLKEEILEALDDRFQGVQQQQHRSQRGMGNFAQQLHFGMPPAPFHQQNIPMDPRLAQHLAMMRGDHHGANQIPPTMGVHPNNPWPPGMTHINGNIPFDDDTSLPDLERMEAMGMRHSNFAPQGMIPNENRPQGPGYLSPRQMQANPRPRFANNRSGRETSPAGMYIRAVPGRETNTMMGRRNVTGGVSQQDTRFDMDSPDSSPLRRSGLGRQYKDSLDGLRGGAGRRDSSSDLVYRTTCSPEPRRNGNSSGRSATNRNRQARADSYSDSDSGAC